MILLLALAAVLAACGARPADRACQLRRFEGARFTVCLFDPVDQKARLIWTDGLGKGLRGFAEAGRELGPERKAVRFAMNAGMFDSKGAPIGLYVENGAERHAVSLTDGPGNFHLKPNGVLWLDDAGAHVAETDVYVRLAPEPRFATQSGPMLVIGGALHPSIQPDGPSELVRNGVGDCGQGRAAFVISGEAVSFGKFARLFRDELKCPNALFLDGTVSSLWAPDQGRMDKGALLGPMIVVSNR